MTTVEFDRWYDDLAAKFPSVEAWLGRVTFDDGGKLRLLRGWCCAMADVPLAEALEVNGRMQSGELTWVGDYDSDKERLPRHVRQHVKQLIADRTPAVVREEFAPATSKTGGFPGAKILRRLWELRDQGMSHEEAREVALREFPVGRSPFREPRYNCATCLDTGRVLIATPAAITAMLQGKFAACHHRDGSAKCHCRGHEAVNPKRPIVVYDPAQDFRIEDTLWRQPEVRRFAEWVEWQREHGSEARAKGHHGYDPDFAAWNQREFAK